MPDPTDLRAALAALVNWHDRVILEPDADVWAAARTALSVPDEAEQAVQEGFARIDAAIADFSNPDTSGCDPELLEAAERAIADPSVNAAAQEIRVVEAGLLKAGAVEAKIGPVAAAPNHLCEVNQFSSRACKRGTKGCTVEHAAPNTQEPER